MTRTLRRGIEEEARRFAFRRALRPARENLSRHAPVWNAEAARYECKECGRLLAARELSVSLER